MPVAWLSTSGADSLGGGNGIDSLLGDVGSDRLAGGNGNDSLSGGNGIDTLTGGNGTDRMGGDAGGDRFVFDDGHAGVGVGVRDVIAGFDGAGGDRIDLSPIDALLSSAGTDQAFTWRGTLAFNASGQIRYATSGGNVIIQGSNDASTDVDFEIQVDGPLMPLGDVALGAADRVVGRAPGTKAEAPLREAGIEDGHQHLR